MSFRPVGWVGAVSPGAGLPNQGGQLAPWPLMHRKLPYYRIFLRD